MKYRRNPDVVFHEVDDRIMMMNPTQAEFVTLTPTGAAVWRALDRPGSCDELVDRIRGDYPGADPTVMRADIETFLRKLEASGAVLPASADGLPASA